MSSVKKTAAGENPSPRASFPKKAKLAKSAANPKAPASDSVQRVSASVNAVSHDRHPGHKVHPRGHNPDAQVRILAHIYQPWAEVTHNGSGIYALAHWAKLLEERGDLAVDDAVNGSAGFLRGLTHR